MSKVLIRGGRVIDPANEVDATLDILVKNGKIMSIAENLAAEDAETIEARDMIVTPGLIDMHVHLREPGREDEETIRTGTRAAIKGGFTSVACMPNTNPVADTASVIEMILEKSREEGMASIFPVAAITKGLKGKELAEMGELVKAGAVAFSDDGESVMNAEVMRRAFEYSRMFNIPLIAHSEDKNLSFHGQMNEGFYSTLLGLKGIPAAAEEVMVARDIILAGVTGGRLHIAHVSTEGTVALIRMAKKAGIRVTCDVTPHHLVLTDKALMNFDTNFKVNPPLRSQRDVQALLKGLSDGTIDAIASDHAPHALHEKEREFDHAPFGIVGLETTLPLMLTKVVETGVLDLPRLIAKLAINPANTLGIHKGSLSIGSDADITIFDHKSKLKVDIDKFESKSKNSPFHGWELNGIVKYVLVAGEIVIREGNIVKGYEIESRVEH
ncbi:MAG: dihydroorotase [Actinomycetota bacterium]|nr:dihydroorotase [Actinomycetota bacterium]